MKIAAHAANSEAGSLLLVEDDDKTIRAMERGLRSDGFEVRSASSGEEAERALRVQRFDLVILDWMLPGKDGIEIVRGIRSRGNDLPVLLLTARDTVEDRVKGLDAGADDYLIKPFAFAELLARIRALLRRRISEDPLQYSVADLEVDWHLRHANRRGKDLQLTPREFEILFCLLRHRGEVVTRSMLTSEVWGELNRVTPLDNVIDVHIGHLRRKVDGGRSPKLIHTVRGIGYTLQLKSPE